MTGSPSFCSNGIFLHAFYGEISLNHTQAIHCLNDIVFGKGLKACLETQGYPGKDGRIVAEISDTGNSVNPASRERRKAYIQLSKLQKLRRDLEDACRYLSELVVEEEHTIKNRPAPRTI